MSENLSLLTILFCYCDLYPANPHTPFLYFVLIKLFPHEKLPFKKKQWGSVFTSLLNEIIMAKGRFDWIQLSLEPLWRDQDNVQKNQTSVNNLTTGFNVHIYMYMCSIYTRTSIQTLISKYFFLYFYKSKHWPTSKHHKLKIN